MKTALIVTIAAGAALSALALMHQPSGDDGLEVEPADDSYVSDLLNSVSATMSNISDMKISTQGIDYLKRKEGFAAKAYFDYAGYSIGYGHLIKAGDGLTKDSVLTQAQAQTLLIQDCEKHENAVKTAIKVPLSQNQFDALCIFVHGCGQRALTRSIAGFINDGENEKAMDVVRQYVNVTLNGQKQKHSGLVTRREQDAQIYETGTYA